MLPAKKVLQKPPAENSAILRGRRKGIFRTTVFMFDSSYFARVRRPAAQTAAASGRLTLSLQTGRQKFSKKDLPCILSDMTC